MAFVCAGFAIAPLAMIVWLSHRRKKHGDPWWTRVIAGTFFYLWINAVASGPVMIIARKVPPGYAALVVGVGLLIAQPIAFFVVRAILARERPREPQEARPSPTGAPRWGTRATDEPS